MTYAIEQAAKDFARAKRAKKYTYQPVGIDAWEKSFAEHIGETVVKTQPYGCPKNGTMGHCYIADAGGRFIGLVLEKSLQPA
jgi:hypothetical protein